MSGAAERATKAFVAEHRADPDAVWSAPGRVNLIGEHTDYNDGYVFPFALPHRTAVAARRRDDGLLTIATHGSDGTLQRAGTLSLEALEPGEAGGWANYPAGVAWALRESGITLPGADLVVAGDVPTGAGLSSSAALECATALALLDTAGRALDGPEAPEVMDIARWTRRAENEFVGAPTGLLDQTASLRCEPAHALFFDVRSGETAQIPFDAAGSGLEVLVVDTRANHSHSESGYGDRRKGCEQAAELLGVPALRDVAAAELESSLREIPERLRPLVRHVVTENDRVLETLRRLRRGELTEVGELLTASHRSLRDDYRVSCEELDVAVEAALESGALGARMTGGGFGGSAIALVSSELRPRTERAVSEAFERHGFTAPRLFTTVPSSGAGRES
ncbi:galactokinase [Actinopolyspora erythraea]|uniref:Galactokinase n=1 Tax=Actinopolyspora erythraea TaxID=414996 RepID=A0A099D4L1_9ACTN|nr:galactokinase [Actinopolyspora erythraea]ASU79520.1 galactokinase [Actinopolyspora erythraea]KGI81093.1 galactokinase [Actinopolyspora erythraea]